jgi:hypothetical protein
MRPGGTLTLMADEEGGKPQVLRAAIKLGKAQRWAAFMLGVSAGWLRIKHYGHDPDPERKAARRVIVNTCGSRSFRRLREPPSRHQLAGC